MAIITETLISRQKFVQVGTKVGMACPSCSQGNGEFDISQTVKHVELQTVIMGLKNKYLIPWENILREIWSIKNDLGNFSKGMMMAKCIELRRQEGEGWRHSRRVEEVVAHYISEESK